MARINGVSAFATFPQEAVAPPVLPTIRFNPNYYFQLASSVSASPSQLATIKTDILDINTAKGFKPGVIVTLGFSNAEIGLGNYQWTLLDAIQTWANDVGCVFMFKLHYRTYATTSDPLDPWANSAVPDYMRSSAANRDYDGSSSASPLNTGGTGTSANGEYSDGLNFNAKLWVPAVAARFTAWMQAIGGRYNDDVLFGGIVINETSTLNGAGTGMTPVNPENNATVMNAYFQNLWQCVIDSRDAFNKCELIVSPNSFAQLDASSPITVYTLMSDYQVGTFIQDGYEGPSPLKPSVTTIYNNLQPHAGEVSYFTLLSGEVSSHKGVNGFDCTSTTSNSLTTGTKSFTTQAGKAFAPGGGDVVNIITDLNDPTNNYMTGTTNSYSGTTLSVTITSKVGTGTFATWTIGKGANFLPPSTIDAVVTYNTTPRTGYAGCTHQVFQVNATSGTSFNAVRYQNQVAYLKVTDNVMYTARPNNYPA